VLSLLPVTILRHLRMCVTETVEGVSDRVLAQTEGQSQEDKHAMEYSFEEVDRDPLRSTVDVAHVFVANLLTVCTFLLPGAVGGVAMNLCIPSGSHTTTPGWQPPLPASATCSP
jgi:hypothetical protein